MGQASWHDGFNPATSIGSEVQAVNGNLPVFQVAVDTILIESDHTAKAIVDLIPVLNVTRLVMGTERPFSR